jgi:hypothetical protein
MMPGIWTSCRVIGRRADPTRAVRSHGMIPRLIVVPSLDQGSSDTVPIQARPRSRRPGLLVVAGRSILFAGRNKFERRSPR